VSRSRARLALDALGLLDAARHARNAYRTLRFIRPNSKYWGKGAPDGQPIPPFGLRILVSASPDIDWFLASGRRGADAVRGVLARNGLDLESAAPVLDFGCGCGRVTRHWAADGIEVHGSDLNRQLVAWCRSHLAFGTFAVNGLAPPLAYPDARFGFVYALSVFTHLPEDLQEAWMRELRRVIRPGGHLLLTTHGEHYLDELTAGEQRAFRAGSLVVSRDDTPGSNICGAYHPEAYVRGRLARGFSVVEFVPKGALGNPFQDSWLLRRD
jgi:2-polyprenyl-3-methyl-5-hydroxy-6-metoxy-1,4-benzoquinol methylase